MSIIGKEESDLHLSPLVLKHTDEKIIVGIDIGGSLSKLSIGVDKKDKDSIDFIRALTQFEEIKVNDYILFLAKFQTPQETTLVNATSTIFPILRSLQSHFHIKTIQATGGGAHKFKEIAETEFSLEFIKHDELLSLVNGYLFLNDSFYDVENDPERNIVPIPSSNVTFPHIAVNIGTGVSIIKVGSPDPKDIKRMSGTIMGGGTLIGLAISLLGVDNYNDILELAKKGDHTKVDLTVSDIYSNSEKDDDDETVAASFGKIAEFIESSKMEKVKKEDIALGLLCMICCHITQLASCLAESLKIKEVLFLGSFTRRGSLAVLCLNKCMKFWGKKTNIKFNYYDGYFGAIGTLVKKK